MFPNQAMNDPTLYTPPKPLATATMPGSPNPCHFYALSGPQVHPRRTQQWPSVTAGDLGRSLEESEALGRVSVRNLQHIPIVTVGLGNVLCFLLVGEHWKLGGMGSPGSVRSDILSWNTQSQCPKAPRALPRRIPTALTDTQEIEGSGKKDG